MTPEQVLATLLVVQLLIPFAKWAGDRLFGGLVKKDDSLESKFDDLAKEVRGGFSSLHSLIAAENKGRAVLERDVERLRKDVDYLQAEMRKREAA